MTWDDFYDRYSDWAESTLRTRISLLEDIGSGEEVCGVISNMPSAALKDDLYHRAVAHGVKFTREDLEDMGCVPIKEVNAPIKEANRPVRRRSGPGLFGVLFTLFMALFGGHKNHGKNVHCITDIVMADGIMEMNIVMDVNRKIIKINE